MLDILRQQDILEEQKGQPDARGRPRIVIDGEIFVEITSSNDPFSSGRNNSEENNIRGASSESSSEYMNRSLYSQDLAD